MISDLYFIVNVFNVIIISVDNLVVCVLLYVIEQVYRLLSLNPECNYNHNHNHNHHHNKCLNCDRSCSLIYM